MAYKLQAIFLHSPGSEGFVVSGELFKILTGSLLVTGPVVAHPPFVEYILIADVE